MTSPNLDKVNPELFARIERFQRVFVSYFPNLRDIEVAATEWNWLQRAVRDPPVSIQRGKAKAGVLKVAKSLRILSIRDEHVPLILPEVDRDDLDPVAQWEGKIIDIIDALWEMEHQGLTRKVIDKFVADANALIDETPETANVNWVAVDAVATLRWLWRRNTGKHGPARALNPASKFHAYLSDGFEFLGIQADPVSAFKRWVKRWPRPKVV